MVFYLVVKINLEIKKLISSFVGTIKLTPKNKL